MPPIDSFTARARPAFCYVIVAILAFNYIGLPALQVCGSHVAPLVLPPDLLTLFGVLMSAYGLSRTAEKVAALPGDSSISVLGVKVSNKSPDTCAQ